MSLTGALQIGRSTLTASQAALQVAGNNMANAATQGFHRRTVHLSPVRGEIIGRGQYIGQGVNLSSIRREIDIALQARLRNAVGDEHSALINQRFLSAIETLQNELTDNDISTMLSTFFNNFSELANNPEDTAIRSVVLQQGNSLAGRITDMSNDYANIRDEIDRALGVSVEKVNDILNKITFVTSQISVSEAVGGIENALRDQRDILLDELSQFLDVSVIEQPNGSINILVNSIPILLSGQSRGLELRTETINGEKVVSIRVASDGTTLDVTTGKIGGLLGQRASSVTPVLDDLNVFAAQLIFQVNRIHSSGQAKTGFSSVTGTYFNSDPTANLNSALTELPYTIENGSFFLHVTEETTGIRTTYQINVDGNSMSLNDLVNEINVVAAVPNVTASIGSAGEFILTATTGHQISFSDDTSGALAALGINTFFTGQSATDIGINQLLLANPNFLAAGGNHVSGSNDTALAIADLPNVKVTNLNGLSLRDFWLNSVNALAVKTDAANLQVQSSALIRESLEAQVLAVSGVSLDEEAINMLTYQRQYQAGARFIQVIDEMFQTLLSIA
ncbi:MAG: flagellar hook-associated protein FlgK [Planctomycetes bacterium]|nr:flagellar hook-associated protein FlgK [Planctomycetota bacterium]